MKTYWDTSAAINAAFSPEVFGRLAAGEHIARLHLLAEFFATMTGRGIEITDEDGNVDRMVLTQKECAAWLMNFAQRVQFEELTKNAIDRNSLGHNGCSPTSTPSRMTSAACRWQSKSA
jgi:hypothetical protein